VALVVAVTFDHRVVDGARAAEFGLAVIGRLERANSRFRGH
jgi:pyruvate/2-oxoglutarate dehydrogenase complex dihydrolipoamide acyltransferase (E2) component